MPIDLAALNGMPDAEFAAALDGVFEYAPWVARQAAKLRPFATLAALHAGLMQQVRSAPDAELLGFLNAHPELAADRLPAGLTTESQSEQNDLGMAAAAGAAALPQLNHAYRERFGWPFIVCVARHTAPDVLRQLHLRLARSIAAERQAALAEIGHITRLRLAARVAGPDALVVSGALSTHVLNTVSGGPATGLHLTLLQEGGAIGTAVTDADGRAGDLLPPGPLRQGDHELQFDAGRYFAEHAMATFYDIVPVRFRITDSEARCHIPLLLAPYGYSTYRGS